MAESRTAPLRVFLVILAAWVLSLGWDLFLHAGLLSRWYLRETSFLLPPEIAFRRIPAGYSSFLLLDVALYWLFARVDIPRATTGFSWGGVVGLTIWGALGLGLWSITTAPPSLLAAWWLGQSFELALAGAVLGAGRGGVALGTLWKLVGAAWIVLVGSVVVMQSVGWVPALRVSGVLSG